MGVSVGSDAVFYRDLTRHFPRAVKGDGVYLWDESGKRYLDGAGGVCVVCIGHHVEEIREAHNRQFDDICFCYHLNFTNEPQIQLADFLIRLAPPGFDKVFFTSGGSEATETALKLAREYYLQKGQYSRHKIIGRWNSYHGNTIGALSMSGHRLRRRLYSPYLSDFPHISPCYCYRCWYGKSYPGCDLDCARELERAIRYEGAENVAAFIGEPISATYGAVVPPDEYWPTIRKICDEYDVLLIADEVITGCGRTGKGFAVEHWGISPDLIAFGKAVSGGYSPLAGVIVGQRVVQAFRQGDGRFQHSFTYVGNPLSCAVGLAVQQYVQKHQLVDRVAELEEYIQTRLSNLLELEMVGAISGKGLLWGLEFVADKESRGLFPRHMRVAERVQQLCLEKGLIALAPVGQGDGERGDTCLLAPPFTISTCEIDDMVAILREAIQEAYAELPVSQ